MAPSQYCSRCGTHLPAESLFCPTCGTSQTGTDHAPTSLSQQEPAILGTGRQPAGLLLHQRYRLLHTLGQGGMGAVYLAQDTQLGDRLVAVKEMSMSRLPPSEIPHAVAQFRNEAHLLAGLHHPSLPVIHEYFSEKERWYLVMSFIEGQSLQAILNATPGNKLPLEKVVHIGIELCEVLEYLHTHDPQIIFRDLKPLNIMLTPKGHICLIDFGIARHFKPEQTKDTAYYYSVGYAPPEQQYSQAQTSPRSDIYSLGATLHQLLSGQNPSKQPFQFTPLHLADPTLPEPLSTLIAHMVEMKEQGRPANVAEVKEQLERVFTPQHLAPMKKAYTEAEQQGAKLPQSPQLSNSKPTTPYVPAPSTPPSYVLTPSVPPPPPQLQPLWMRRTPTKISTSRRVTLLTMTGLIIIALTGGIAWFATHQPVPAGTITEFPIPLPSSRPIGITTGPDGNIWFTEETSNQIGRITPSGTITEFPLPLSNSDPTGITTGPDGNIWFTENARIGRITPTGTITEFPLPTSDSYPDGITAGPDGNIWFTEYLSNQIGRITPSGTITEFPLPLPLSDSYPTGITAGPDGNLWFTISLNNQIGRITPSGTITEFPLPLFDSRPDGITAGPDGNLWFTEDSSNQIGRITSGK